MEYSLSAGKTLWRADMASRFSLIIDGATYFKSLREVLIEAEDMAMLVGWDFDFEIEMLPGQSDAQGNAPDGFPNAIGAFLEALVDRRPKLDIYLLKWSGGVLLAPSGLWSTARIKFMAPSQVHLALDGSHPVGASHHQKIVVVDDALAFCGGIDVTTGRWDTHEHKSHEPRRADHNNEILPPWHDATAIMSGPVAKALGDLTRQRWARARNETLPEPDPNPADLWPNELPVQFRGTTVGIARTHSPTQTDCGVNEIEELYLASIRAAKDFIYLESQYFSSDSIAKEIGKALKRPQGPEVVVINPKEAFGTIEDMAMHNARDPIIKELRANDPYDRFRIFYPMNEDGDAIYVHAKLSIIDDDFLRVGSSNIDRRSMCFDTECDVALLAQSPEDKDMIQSLRRRLLGEHLGCSDADLARALRSYKQVIPTIESLQRPEGRSLRPIEERDPSQVGQMVADSKIFDPRYVQRRRRSGVSSRHIFAGVALSAAALAIWQNYRSDRRGE